MNLFKESVWVSLIVSIDLCVFCFICFQYNLYHFLSYANFGFIVLLSVIIDF